MEYIIFIALAFLGYAMYQNWQNSVLKNIDSHENHFFDDTKFSAQAFYNLVIEGVKRREIQDVSISKIYLSEAGILTHNREYLRISRSLQTFDICGAPFGTGFFVSIRFGKKNEWIEWIPILGKLSYVQTYFQIDTDSMYKAIIKVAVNEAMDKIKATDNGLRSLSDVGTTAEQMTN
jgi:hypothetical protein